MAYRYEINPIAQDKEIPDLVIDGWENGIAAAPESGVNIKNCNIESFPTAVRPGWALNQVSTPSSTFTFTANAATDVITLTGTGATTVNFNLQAMQVSTTGSLPGGLSAATTYYLITSGGFGSGQYKLATTLANALVLTSIDITSTGSGVQTIANTAASVSMATINYIINVPITNSGTTSFFQFAFDSTGKVWYWYSQTSWVLIAGNTSSNNSGNGMTAFVSSGGTTYLFCIANSVVDVLTVDGTFTSTLTPTWNNAWMILNEPTGFSGSHYALLGQDNKIYICDGRYIDSISEVTTKNFSPTDATTYTQNRAALTLPSTSSAQCLEELGINLLVGDKNTNYIFPWDRTSTSFALPLRVAEANIFRMKNVDNTVYVLPGSKGTIYQTTGYAFTREMKIPEYLSGGTVTWGGMEKVSGSLIFGVGTGVNPGAVSTIQGVYKLYTNVGAFAGSVVGSLICDQTPLDSNGNPLNATALLSNTSTTAVPDEFYLVGTAGAIYQPDSTNRTVAYGIYGSYVESDLIPVGTANQPRGFNTIEYKLDYAPTSGGIRISWRTDLQATYVVINDFNCAGKISDSIAASIQGAQYIQFKVELKGGTLNNTPRLREIRLR